MIKHHFSKDVYIREQGLRAAKDVDTHIHNFDHLGILGSGTAAVELDGSVTVHEGPCVVEIKAGKHHKITALTDITWFCVHATGETDVDKIDRVLIKGE
jgi:mannose-6-phosphate isomerase-like protein (cupin superfamily)